MIRAGSNDPPHLISHERPWHKRSPLQGSSRARDGTHEETCPPIRTGGPMGASRRSGVLNITSIAIVKEAGRETTPRPSLPGCRKGEGVAGRCARWQFKVRGQEPGPTDGATAAEGGSLGVAVVWWKVNGLRDGSSTTREADTGTAPCGRWSRLSALSDRLLRGSV